MADSNKHQGSSHHFKRPKTHTESQPTCESCGKDITLNEARRNMGLCDGCLDNELHGGKI